MGKYLKKSKPKAADVSQPSSSHLLTTGVRTRAKTLALQLLRQPQPPPPEESESELCYLQLRSRRLHKANFSSKGKGRESKALEEDEEEKGEIDPSDSVVASFGENDPEFDARDSTPEIGSTQVSGGSARSSKKRKASMMEVMEDGYKSMASSVEKLSVALVGTGKKIVESKYEKAQNEEIYAAVDALGLDEDYKIKCYCYLTGHPSKAAQITGAPGSIREKLLDGIMASAGDD